MPGDIIETLWASHIHKPKKKRPGILEFSPENTGNGVDQNKHRTKSSMKKTHYQTI